ncbi:MAG: S1 RNA-binding domain-containing protein, partial [Treponema sp.]|nr:S1 RNA-binding domain-containing protein [Treponema sp.]
GGFEVKIGSSRAFCPYSQMGFRKKEEPAFYVGKHLTFIITEYKEDGRNILVSNKAIGQSEYNNKLASLASEITEGAIVEGVVESIEKFGAFVNISGFRALLPISEISFERIDDVGTVLKEGEKLTLKVLKTDWKNERVSVSLKALIKSPWETVEEKFSVGSKIDGEISRIADFGLFINLDKGIDGLLHISELEGLSENSNLHKMYKVGQKMSVIIEKIDVKQKRISLKTASSAEQDKTAKKYISSQNDDGETYNPFAMLLKK